MATSLSIDTNFVGTEAGEYIGKMIQEANTISENLVTVLPNLVSPVFVRKIETADGFVDYTCGWDAAGGTTLSENELAPKKIKWDSEYCKEDFRQLWTSYQMGFSAFNDNLPQTEQAAMLNEMGKVIARKIDLDIWNGDGQTGNFSGLIPLLTADTDVIDVAGEAGGVTAANVEVEIGKVIDAIPDAVLGASDLVIGVATNVIRAIRRAYGTQARANGTFLKPSEFDFEGYTLTEIKGLPANYMVAYAKENVFFGTGLLGDMNEIKIKDMDDSDLSGMIRMKTVMTGGVQIAWGGEIVLYTTAV